MEYIDEDDKPKGVKTESVNDYTDPFEHDSQGMRETIERQLREFIQILTPLIPSMIIVGVALISRWHDTNRDLDDARYTLEKLPAFSVDSIKDITDYNERQLTLYLANIQENLILSLDNQILQNEVKTGASNAIYAYKQLKSQNTPENQSTYLGKLSFLIKSVQEGIDTGNKTAQEDGLLGLSMLLLGSGVLMSAVKQRSDRHQVKRKVTYVDSLAGEPQDEEALEDNLAFIRENAPENYDIKRS